MTRRYSSDREGGRARRLAGVTAAAALAFSGVAVAAGTAAAVAPTSFAEDFDSNTFGPNLTTLLGSPSVSGGTVVLPNFPHGNVVGTVDSNHHTADFCAEVTVLDHPQPNNDNRVYLGLGRGALQGNGDTSYPLAEPAVMIRHITSWAGTANNINNLTIAVSANTAVAPATGATEITNQTGVGPGYGPYTLGIDYAAPMMTFLVDGVPFHDPVDVSDYDFSGQGRIFFAGQNVVLDDFSVASGSCFAPPPPVLEDPPSAVWGLGYLGHDGPAAVDADGNVYQSGRFGLVRDFDPGPGEYLMDSADGNIFTAKFDATGEFVWARQWTAAQVYGMATGPDGSIYNVGQCHCENTDADPGPGVVLFPDASNGDAFIQKLDADGNFLWAHGYAGGNHDVFQTVSTDAAGNVLVGGNYSTGGVARMYDSAGNVLWTDVTAPLATGSAFDSAGNAYATGRGTTNKWAADGTLVWSKQVPGSYVTFDDVDNMYISGGFYGTVDFDPGPGVYELTSHSNLGVYWTDASVAKFDSAGALQWVAAFGGPGDSTAGARASVDADGNVWVATNFRGDVDVDPGPGVHPVATGSADPTVTNIAVIKLDDAGNLASAGVMTTLYNTGATLIVAHDDGGLYLAGASYGNPATIDVDPSADVLQLTGAGVFIARLGTANVIDTDGDGIGDDIDLDDDGDGQSDADELACGSDPLDAGSTSTDTDGDGMPDCVDLDDDGDGVLDDNDAFPLDSNESTDADGDGIGDNADTDDDNDGVDDTTDAFPLDATEWADCDGDGIGDNADTDDDNDGTPDATDAFPCDASESVDTDGDGIGDNADTDDDNDNVLDGDDAFPLDGTEWADNDLDGIGDNADTDDDNDGTPDAADAFPFDPGENADNDGDGIGDNADTDDDNDGVLDGDDVFPFNPDEWADCDGDGTGDNADPDDDNDTVADVDDAFPCDPAESADADGDGIGDNADTDDDGDGVLDGDDAFPLDGTEWADADGDGIGDNADTDDDNDGVDDADDRCAASDIAPTVVIQGTDTGITNAVLADGCSMNDLIAQAIADAGSQGELSSSIAHLTNSWKKAGLITGKQKGLIQSTVTYQP